MCVHVYTHPLYTLQYLYIYIYGWSFSCPFGNFVGVWARVHIICAVPLRVWTWYGPDACNGSKPIGLISIKLEGR